MDVLLAVGYHIVRSTQPAGSRGAHLNQMLAHGMKIEHRVEGRHFQHADVRHAKKPCDFLDHRLRDSSLLFLRAPQDRNDRRGLPPGWIFPDLVLTPRRILRAEGEALRLMLGKA